MEAVNIYPVLKTWKPNRQGLMPIVICFDFKNAKVSERSIGQRVAPDHWNEAARRVRDGHPLAPLINSLLETEIARQKAIFMRRHLLGLPVTKEIVIQYAKGNNQEDFLAYAEWVIDNKKLKDGQGYDPDTKRRYRDEIARLRGFQDMVLFGQLTPDFLGRYKSWMQNEYKKEDGSKLHANSIWKALSFIRMVYNFAVDKQMIIGDANPFKTFKILGRPPRLPFSLCVSEYRSCFSISAANQVFSSRLPLTAKHARMRAFDFSQRFPSLESFANWSSSSGKPPFIQDRANRRI